MSDKKPYKVMKVFDPHYGMPKEVCKAFMDLMRDRELHNDSMVTYRIKTERHDWDTCKDTEYFSETKDQKFKLLHEWLLANDVSEDESIVIKYWW